MKNTNSEANTISSANSIAGVITSIDDVERLGCIKASMLTVLKGAVSNAWPDAIDAITTCILKIEFKLAESGDSEMLVTL